MAHETKLAVRQQQRLLTRAIVLWTLLYWACVYVVFTLRSLANPQPPLLTQAGLRGAMMIVGLTMSALLLLAFRNVPADRLARRWPLVGGTVFAATLSYFTINYWVFYTLPGIWTAPHGGVAKIASHVIEHFWLFLVWTIGYYYVRGRETRARASSPPRRIDHIWARSHGRNVRVPLSDVRYMAAEGDYVRIHLPGQTHLVRATMRSMEERLDPAAFVRIHRSAMVAIDGVAAVERAPTGRLSVRLRTGELLPAGRNYLGRLRPPPAAPSAEMFERPVENRAAA